MNSQLVVELTEDIEKLAVLEESIIDGDHAHTSELRSRQALLLSEVIQSLQKVKHTLTVAA